MKNIALFNSMINGYNAVSYTHNYIYGFEYKHNIYMSFQSADTMPLICTLDKSPENNAGMSLRFKPTVAQKVFLLTSAKLLCSETYFNEACAQKYENIKGEMVKYNRGEIFEKLVTEYFGQVWVKDAIPFTDGPDVVDNGIPYQIKYQKGTFIHEKALASLTMKKNAKK